MYPTTGWVFDCPACSPGAGKWKLGINENSLACHCWTCGRVSLLAALASVSGRRESELRPLVERLRGSRKPLEAVKRGRGVLVVPKGVGPLLGAHKKYLEGRGFCPDGLERVWGVQGIGHAPRLSWRLWLPVTLGGRVVSWTTRSVGGAKQRYVSARPDEEEWPHKSLLYGADLCHHAVVVTEGPFDAMRVGPGAVATFGTSVSRAQVVRMLKFPVRVVCFDAEPAARRAAESLCATLGTFPGRTVRVELDAPDPGSAEDSEIKQLRKEFLT